MTTQAIDSLLDLGVRKRSQRVSWLIYACMKSDKIRLVTWVVISNGIQTIKGLVLRARISTSSVSDKAANVGASMARMFTRGGKR